MGTWTTLATVSRRPAGGLDTPERFEQLIADTDFWVRRAARMGARMVAFTEVCPQLTVPGGKYYDWLEPHDGGTLPRIAELAQRHDVDIVWPRFETGPDGRRNASLYVDRHGEVLGRYYKMFPTLGEMDEGILPGEGGVVVETEFGRVGFAICFDLNFVELRDSYRPLHPDVIVFSSMYRGGGECQTWAVDLGCFFVSSHGTELGRIIDRGGRILELATYEGLVTARVNLNSIQLHMDQNWGKMDAMLEKYGADLRFDYYTQEGRYVISSERVPIDEIVAEYGLWRIDDYFRTVRERRPREMAQAAAPVCVV